MHKAIADACGVKTANLSLGQAMEELAPSWNVNPALNKDEEQKAIDLLEGRANQTSHTNNRTKIDLQNDAEHLSKTGNYGTKIYIDRFTICCFVMIVVFYKWMIC